MRGHFEFFNANTDGTLHSEPFRVETEEGVIINCHPKCNVSDIRRLCEIARTTPNYPVDLSASKETAQGKQVIWTARIYWRDA